MSWISDNYEKAAIGGAAVIALAFAAVIMKNKGLIDEATVLPSVKENNDVSVPGLPVIAETKISLENEHVINVPDDGGRKLNLFTGVPLFAKKDDRKNPVDLPKSPPVHQGMQNTWWLKYGLNPGNSDAPEQDPDGDGFTNREEYVAETSPIDDKNHPDPIAKLKVNGVKTTQVHVRAQDFGGGKFTFKLETKGGTTVNKMGMNPIEPGTDITFVGKLMKDRFKFIDIEEKEVVKGGIRQKVKEWIIEDKKPNKKGQFRINRQGKPGILDSTVEFTLDALKQDGKPFKVEENTAFSLPFDANAKEKPYLLKKVDLVNKKVEVEYTDKEGNKKTKNFDF